MVGSLYHEHKNKDKYLSLLLNKDKYLKSAMLLLIISFYNGKLNKKYISANVKNFFHTQLENFSLSLTLLYLAKKKCGPHSPIYKNMRYYILTSEIGYWCFNKVSTFRRKSYIDCECYLEIISPLANSCSSL